MRKAEFIFITLLWLNVACFIIIINYIDRKKEKEKYEITINDKTKEIIMYRNVLHRIWLTKPAYVEDVLVESDEFNRLNELYNGDWEDVFELWDEQDTIDYKINKYIEQSNRF